MAAPALTGDRYLGSRMRVVTYGQSGANDGNVDLEIPRSLASLSAQLTGTYVAGTMTIQGSNDGTTFAALPTAKSLSALGVLTVVDLGFRYYRFAFATMNAGNTLVLTVVAKSIM